ncbi:hypothetical protein [Lysobacter gummosus]|uniref:hypothetical protein n=1 Tax=Lysobacter gummosus TaxID=262324 RepID=UPI003633C22B
MWRRRRRCGRSRRSRCQRRANARADLGAVAGAANGEHRPRLTIVMTRHCAARRSGSRGAVYARAGKRRIPESGASGAVAAPASSAPNAARARPRRHCEPRQVRRSRALLGSQACRRHPTPKTRFPGSAHACCGRRWRSPPRSCSRWAGRSDACARTSAGWSIASPSPTSACTCRRSR